MSYNMMRGYDIYDRYNGAFPNASKNDIDDQNLLLVTVSMQDKNKVIHVKIAVYSIDSKEFSSICTLKPRKFLVNNFVNQMKLRIALC
jgi:hypothetical protein